MNDFSGNVRTANAKQKIGLQSENTKSSPWFSFLNGGKRLFLRPVQLVLLSSSAGRSALRVTVPSAGSRTEKMVLSASDLRE